MSWERASHRSRARAPRALEAGLLLATVLAATVLLLCLLPAHARAETTCRLAELTRADVELFQHTRGEDVVPRRCNARKELVSWTPACRSGAKLRLRLTLASTEDSRTAGQ